MSVLERLNSFENYPGEGDAALVEEMAEAGLYYKENKGTFCFLCQASVDVAPSDDPWCRHAQENPHCEFMWDRKGHQFIKTALDQCGKVDRRFERRRRISMSVIDTRPQRDPNMATLHRRPSLPPRAQGHLDLIHDLDQLGYSQGQIPDIPEFPIEFDLHSSRIGIENENPPSLSPVQAEDPRRCQRGGHLFDVTCVRLTDGGDGHDGMAGHLYCSRCDAECPYCGCTERQDVFWSLYEDLNRE